jgi:D-sedoheptulose 7-phosphate isomerase
VKQVIDLELDEHQETLMLVKKNLTKKIETAALVIINALKNGNKLMLCGNGGSAADAQHIAAELTGRYKIERNGLPGIALSVDTSALTAIGNDYGFEKVFSRQVEALAKAGDVLLAISTSGNSPNVLEAIRKARELDCICIGLSGNDGGKMNEEADINLTIPSCNTPRIQEMHILIGHILCQSIDDAFKEK